MGREICRLAGEGYEGIELAAGADQAADGSDPMILSRLEDVTVPADCVVDFSHHSCTDRLLAYALARRLPVVIATTGQTEEELSAIREASGEIPVFLSANMSIGVALLAEMAKTAARAFPDADIEIVEKHHSQKLDAPSGTALLLARAIGEVRPDATYNCGRSGHGKRPKDEIGIHSLRLGGLVGEHEVILATPTQTITLKHEAHSRALFAEGALKAAAFLVGRRPGLYDVNAMLK